MTTTDPRATALAVTMFPSPLVGYYEYGDPPRRETYIVRGVAMTEPEVPDAARLYRATWLLCERSDHRLTWLSLSALTLADEQEATR